MDLLTTQQAAELLGVSPSTMKRWADQDIVSCVRSAGGHRRFRRQDLAALAEQTGLDDLEASGWIHFLRSEAEPHALAARLLLARSREDTWWRVADRLGEVLQEIGLRWERGELTVLEEHIMSERLGRALSWVVQTMPVSVDAPRALLIGAEGDDHTLGLSLAEVVLREAGWQSHWAGRRTPTENVVDLIRSRSVDLVAISASASSTDTVTLDRQYQAIVAEARPAGIPVVLGGRGAWTDPAFGRRLNSMRDFYAMLNDLPRPGNGS